MTGRPVTPLANTISGDATLSGGTVQAGVVHGGIHFHHAPVPLPRPAQLPRPPAHFTDRRDHLDALDTASRGCAGPGSGPLVALSGGEGMGKTALAVHWLHTHRADFPDGLLYADISRAGGPRSVLRQWLGAFGHQRAPADLGELVALWRSVTAELRIAVLIDDVTDPATVPDLMPGAAQSLSVVTSRRKLWELALHNARFRDLGPLPPDEAVQLLTRYVGAERVSADPVTARRIAEAHAGVPLALTLTGARVAAHSDLPLTPVPLPAPSPEDPAMNAVTAALDASYQSLPPAAQLLYRQLAALPTAIVDVHGTAAAAALTPRETEQTLLALSDARLLNELAVTPFGPRYAFATAAHAQALAATHDDEESRVRTLRRLCDWVLWTASAGQQRLTPAQATLPRSYAHEPVDAPAFDDDAVARAWFRVHQDGLLATIRSARDAGWHRTGWQLVDAHWPLFLYDHPHELWIEAHRIGLECARLDGDTTAERQMLNSGAIGLSNAGQVEEAIEWYTHSLTLATAANDVRDTGQVHLGLAGAHFTAGRPEQTTSHVRKAVELWETCGYPRGVALAWTLDGEIALAEGDPERAVRLFTDAHARLTELGDRFDANRALAFRGHARALDGEHQAGLEELDRAREMFDHLGAERWQARVRHLLGEAYATSGDTGKAREQMEDAARRYERFSPAGAEPVYRALRELTG
ncbi:NB-ARC domain-containing protein [Streptomyces niveus]|uniref:NB-ARC domain-containing protein n=1 Tax=Streptomyces niveus TaxID=193462 RepID=UPI00366135D2